MKRKEKYWAQNSRSRWLKGGDKNTKYIHAIASIQRRRNAIECLRFNGNITCDPNTIKKEAVNYFKGIFKEEYLSRPTFTELNFKTLSQEQNAMLTQKFSHEENDAAVASCDSSKAPGPDGFNFRFIKNS